MFPVVRDNVEKYYLLKSEDNQKRQRTDETACKAIAFNLQDAPAFDIIIKEEFLEQAC